MKIIWATRGYSWGFRFLLDGGYRDPLAAYEHAFEGQDDVLVGCRRVGDNVALRFPDPLERRDASGRVIPHDFVVMEPLSSEINSVDEGLKRIWPLVSDLYAQLWRGEPPSDEAIRSALDPARPDSSETRGRVGSS